MRCRCGQELAVMKSSAGKKVQCPSCSAVLRVPDTQQQPPNAQTSNAQTSSPQRPRPRAASNTSSGNAARRPTQTPARASTPTVSAPKPTAAKSSAQGSSGPASSGPASSDLLKMRCPCGRTLTVRKSAAGATVLCPQCKRKLRVPGKPVDTPRQRPVAVAQPVTPIPAAAPLDFGGLPPVNTSGPAAAPTFHAPAPQANPYVTAPRPASPTNPYHSPTTVYGGSATTHGAAPVASGNAVQIRNQYLNHEASVRSLGLLYYIGSSIFIIGTIGGIFILLAGIFGKDPEVTVGLGLILLLIYGSFAGGFLFIGHGLRQLKNGPRIAAGIFSAIGLLGFPIGTIIHGYFLFVLFSEKGVYVCSEPYRQIVRATPHIKYKTHWFVWTIAIVFLVIIVLSVLIGLILPAIQ